MKRLYFGVSENYLFNYIYMTPTMYEKITEGSIKYNQIFANTISELSASDIVDLTSYLKENDKVSGITITQDINESYQESLESLLTVVVLFIGSSVLLSCIVLYNLNNINIAERRREFATMKVLGYEDSQIAKQIHKENIIISIMGSILRIIFRITSIFCCT